MATLGVLHDNLQVAAAGSLTAGVSVASAGDKWTFTPNVPVRIIRWGIICDTSYTVTPPKFQLDQRPTAGSDTNRVAGAVTNGIDAAGGTIQAPTIGAAGTLQGQGLYHNVFQGVQAASGLDGFILFPGQQAVFKVATAATAGTGFAFIEFETLSFQGDPNTPGVGTQSLTINPLVNMVKVAA